ncbi:MAG: class I SAM-dependent methyltransferase [Rhodoferax sp.]|nr:class I SAM-dependent methyltransferase [Rhodoferax sp.]HQX57771.1 class I SAM-dependent methyltransferase [Burkholderiaceae bacterium]
MTASSPGFSDAAIKWNQRFAHDGYLFGTEPNVYLREQLARLPATGHALCVADGEGRNSVWLARQGLQVQAFDISDVGVAKARKLAQDAGVQVDYQVADCDQWDWPRNQFDVVAAIFIQFADPAMRTRLFARMVDSLKPGGLLIVQGYTPKQIDYKTGGPGILANLYTEEMMRDAFAALEILELRMYEADLAEGEHHLGRSALVGLAARKR